jgi:hypothetical protein
MVLYLWMCLITIVMISLYPRLRKLGMVNYLSLAALVGYLGVLVYDLIYFHWLKM